MSDKPELELPQKEKWGSKLGVILAVAGSAVGLGNFLRFPGVAVNNGGGAFMIPYVISFLVLGIPIAWCEWTMGRLGGQYGQNSAPGIMYALWRRGPAKAVGAMTILIPLVIYMYYVLLEAWCLNYCIEFINGGFAETFAAVTKDVSGQGDVVSAVVGATNEYFETSCGLKEHGALFTGGRMLWVVLICFVVNFVIIYRGITKGIETFCKFAMPALIICAVIILVRVLTLPDISVGLGFMWNPQWSKLGDPGVWLAASGQIFFSLSVGFGLILCYSSYLREKDDVVLTSLSACSTNEFCEVILGGLIVVPTAFLFLGADAARSGTFGLGFVTIPAIMNFMPGGNFFGAMWFGLLFLAAVTSSLSMLQPAIAFLEDGFGLRRRASVTLLATITTIGAAVTMYFSKGALALNHTDFWCNLMMIVAATFQVIIFGWVIGAEKGVREMNRGADLRVPRFMAFMIRFITPAFLIAILIAWSWNTMPGYLDQMSPTYQGNIAERKVLEDAISEHYAKQELDASNIDEKTLEILGPVGEAVDTPRLPQWLQSARPEARAAQEEAADDATIARFVFVGIVVIFILLVALADIACRSRIGRMIEAAERHGAGLESTA